MKIGVCELCPEMMPGTSEWERILALVRQARPDLLLLNELTFGPWIAGSAQPDPAIGRGSQQRHAEGVLAIPELQVPVVLGTRAVEQGGRLVNEAFVWTAEKAAVGVHTKQYFPDEAGFYEARWYQAGERHFRAVEAGGIKIGFLICSEVMFNEHARHYGRMGAHLIAAPRATPPGSLERWLVALRMAAIVSGSYVASSNRSGADSKGQKFGGHGWIIDPNGEMVAQTSQATPVAFYDIDPRLAESAQREYPCYIPE
jgi:N-carbamoylputrescine amidase